jgi:hypothetical protein
MNRLAFLSFNIVEDSRRLWRIAGALTTVLTGGGKVTTVL